jgi:hypothetical protein
LANEKLSLDEKIFMEEQSREGHQIDSTNYDDTFDEPHLSSLDRLQKEKTELFKGVNSN